MRGNCEKKRRPNIIETIYPKITQEELDAELDDSITTLFRKVIYDDWKESELANTTPEPGQRGYVGHYI